MTRIERTKVDAMTFHTEMFNREAVIWDTFTAKGNYGERILVVRWSWPSNGNYIIGRQQHYVDGRCDHFIQEPVRPNNL